MLSGNEWLIIVILVLVLALPVLVVVVVLAARSRRPTAPVVGVQFQPSPVPFGGSPAPGWFPDPARRHQLRYWDGTSWTEHVQDGQLRGVDRLG